jgi:hypothetical protein
LKQIISAIIAISFLFVSCKSDKGIIVDEAFTGSLIKNYRTPAEYNANETELRFWKDRIDPKNPGLTNELKYAAALLQRFHLTGNINDIILADSVLYAVDRTYAHKEAAPIMALFRNAILQHRFKEADSLLQQAKTIGIRNYESTTASFDIAFEQGAYLLAEGELKKIDGYKDYGYQFRLAKLAHYKGELDAAIEAMHKAAELAGENIYLKQAALSNEADLNLHNGNLQKAYELYSQSVKLSAADLHSTSGIGWIALVHDKNDSLAEKLFLFVRSKTKSPDILFKLYQIAEAKADSNMQKKYATDFASVVTAPVYGNMYNKYLIEIYTGILKDPARAEAIAKKELLNRSTAQTYAWYVWALHANKRSAEAEKIYQQHVSGKPLEGLELYWMGKFMQAQNKGYNAKEFFKAAYKNRYDLGVEMVKELEKELE